jgi:hypothetical protein
MPPIPLAFISGGGVAKEPAGSYNFANGFSGSSYKPQGYTTVTLTLRGSGGRRLNNNQNAVYGLGSIVTKNNVPVATLNIYCPSGNRVSQWAGGGSGGVKGVTSTVVYDGGDGGGVCAATWDNGSSVMVAAGGGGGCYVENRVGRQGSIEGTTYGSSFQSTPAGNNGGNGSGASCYYGGGGGGGGYSQGGAGGSVNVGGRAGGNGATPSTGGPGSYNYDTITVGAHSGGGTATISWA